MLMRKRAGGAGTGLRFSLATKKEAELSISLFVSILSPPYLQLSSNMKRAIRDHLLIALRTHGYTKTVLASGNLTVAQPHAALPGPSSMPTSKGNVEAIRMQEQLILLLIYHMIRTKCLRSRSPGCPCLLTAVDAPSHTQLSPSPDTKGGER